MRRDAVALGCGLFIGFAVWHGNPETVTETVTERVEVEGPTVVRYERVPLPDSCTALAEEVERASEAVSEYSSAVSEAPENLDWGVSGLARNDMNMVNQSITKHHQIESDTASALMILSESTLQRIPSLQRQCREDMEETE
jgi:hypothetical protein